MRAQNLIAFGYVNDSIGGKDAGFGGSAYGGESLLAHGASRFDSRPFHDADETEVVIAAIDVSSYRFPFLQQTYSAAPRVHFLLRRSR